jgi:hypothetical protein
MKTEKTAESPSESWFPGSDQPKLAGSYEVRLRDTKDVMTGHYAGGRWKFEYQGMTSSVKLSPTQFEWRKKPLATRTALEDGKRWTGFTISQGIVKQNYE